MRKLNPHLFEISANARAILNKREKSAAALSHRKAVFVAKERKWREKQWLESKGKDWSHLKEPRGPSNLIEHVREVPMRALVWIIRQMGVPLAS
jgi:hypothetical protein